MRGKMAIFAVLAILVIVITPVSGKLSGSGQGHGVSVDKSNLEQNSPSQSAEDGLLKENGENLVGSLNKSDKNRDITPELELENEFPLDCDLERCQEIQDKLPNPMSYSQEPKV